MEVPKFSFNFNKFMPGSNEAAYLSFSVVMPYVALIQT